MEFIPTGSQAKKIYCRGFREVEADVPACGWGTAVVQPNCAVRIGRIGDVSDRAPADQRTCTADGRRRESTVPQAQARGFGDTGKADKR